MQAQDINRPEIVAEVTAVFAAYEEALVRNDVARLNELFWEHPQTVRYGIAEHAVGSAAVHASRAALAPVHPQRRRQRTVITTFGHDTASVCTEFTAPDSDRIGRQTQMWVRMPEGWRIVAAHVSLVAAKDLTRY
jgi:hypothetical protein